jgi:acyl-CoA synthetase (AMP-forming)/AMP-acid ligase II
MSVFRLWIGRERAFPEECERLIALLRDVARVGLVLSTAPREGFSWICDPGEVHCGGDAGSVTLYTSATTGPAKPVTKRWEDILASKRGRGSPEDAWLLAYSPARWAGLSVMAHALRHCSRLVVPESLSVRDVATALPRATHVSLTPSLFRKLLASGAELAAPSLRQVTFGGEAATQRVLDTARACWPAARVSHVYASTELGDVASASDGREGFERLPGDVLPDGELVVAGFSTGDLWERRGDRWVFVGRRTDTIHVGGAKVSPFEVERVLNGMPGVLEARVYGAPSPLLGQIVCADYRGDAEPRQLAASLRELLPKYAVPRLRRVDEIALTAAGKVGRT